MTTILPLERYVTIRLEPPPSASATLITPDTADTGTHMRWGRLERVGENCHDLIPGERVLVNILQPDAVTLDDLLVIPETAIWAKG
jgi:hypothetical protein